MTMKTIACLRAALLATGVLAQTPSPHLTQAEAEAAVKAVLPALQRIRGITFKDDVPVTVIDDARARAYALARFRKMTPDAKIRADETVYRLLGLVPKDLDVLKSLLDVLEEQAGGFYDPTTKSFYLLDDMPKDMTPLLAAHEMTHALEDQRYDIDARLAKVADDDDATFALSALAEGSASAAAAVYVADAVTAGKLDPKRVAAMGDAVKVDRLNAMTPSLRRMLIGPYVLGMTFLTRGRVDGLQGGYPARDVEAAWAHPPRSSEQILHPEKYWDPARRDEPIRVVVADPSRVLGDGWERVGSGVLGELTLGGLVGAATPDAAELAAGATSWTNRAASGWGGDRYELWSNGDDAVVLLATVWDRVRDAGEFAEALASRSPEFAFRRVRDRVAIVAGAAGDRRSALLSILLREP